MKTKFALFTAMIVCGLFTQAQQKTDGITFGIRGGVNFQNINGKDGSGNELKNDLLTAYHAGINVEIPVSPQFFIQPGLLYTIKGAKNEDVLLGQTITSTTKISYVEIPLNFIFKPALGTGRMLLGFGPYAAFGIGGKRTYEGGPASTSEDIKFKNTVAVTDAQNVAYFRPMDAGANLLAGYEFNSKLSFQLNAQLGLMKINSEYTGFPNDQTSAKNTGFGLSVGYRF